MASQLLAPLFPIFKMLVAATLAAPVTPHDALLLDIAKCLHHTVRSYLPKSLAPHLHGCAKARPPTPPLPSGELSRKQDSRGLLAKFCFSGGWLSV